MSSVFSKGSVKSFFCDFYSEFNATDLTFSAFGLKWPEDFEETPDIGNSRFQIIRDFTNGTCLINHEGRLYPYTEKQILERRHKIKKNVVIEKLGKRTPFQPSNVFFLETGFNLGNVQFINFDFKKEESNPLGSFRKIKYSFPLFWLIREVVALDETKNNRKLAYDLVKQLESEKILQNKELNGWKLEERDTSPSEDEYLEKCERPLHDYYFTRGNQVNIWLKFEFFEA